MESHSLAAPIRELEVAAAVCIGEVGDLERTVRSLKGGVAAPDDKANNAEARGGKMMDKLSELRMLVEGLNQTVGSERTHVLGLVHAE